MEIGYIYAFQSPKQSPVESHIQGMTEYAAFRVPLNLRLPDAPGGGHPCSHDAPISSPLPASSEM